MGRRSRYPAIPYNSDESVAPTFASIPGWGIVYPALVIDADGVMLMSVFLIVTVSVQSRGVSIVDNCTDLAVRGEFLMGLSWLVHEIFSIPTSFANLIRPSFC